jgi:hypothetical protein
VIADEENEEAFRVFSLDFFKGIQSIAFAIGRLEIEARCFKFADWSFIVFRIGQCHGSLLARERDL